MGNNSLIPKIDLPRYFTVTSMGLGPSSVAVQVTAELAHGEPYTTSKSFNKSHIVLDDFVDILPIDREKIPKMARFFLVTIALPREFQLAASRVQDNKNKIELSFELRGDTQKRWSKTFDTAHLNLADLSVLLDWAKEAVKYQR